MAKAARRFGFDDDFLDAVAAFIAQLEFGGHPDAAAELRVGFAFLSGPTEGASQFLESVKKIETSYGKKLAPRDRAMLKKMRAAAQTSARKR